MTRVLRCAACARRIRGAQAHVDLIDVDSGREISYHAHPSCQRRGAEEMASLLDLYPAGPVLSLNGAKTLLSWDRLAVVELVED